MEERLSNYDESFEGVDSDEESSHYKTAPEHYIQDFNYSPICLLEKHNWEDRRHDSLHQALWIGSIREAATFSRNAGLATKKARCRIWRRNTMFPQRSALEKNAMLKVREVIAN